MIGSLGVHPFAVRRRSAVQAHGELLALALAWPSERLVG